MMTFLSELMKYESPVEHHNTLNPKIWNESDELEQEVEHALLRIAREYIDFLNMPEGFDVVDIILTGSSANYNYTKFSDIDLHIIANISEAESVTCSVVDVKEFFRAKKSLWSQQHNIKIHNIPVEVYVQLEDEKLVAAGVYSLTKDKWTREPLKLDEKTRQIDQYAIQLKADAIMCEIDNVIDNKIDEMDSIRKIKDKIKQMRQSGLAIGGEYSAENLAFKALRNNGFLERLDKYQKQILDKGLSI